MALLAGSQRGRSVLIIVSFPCVFLELHRGSTKLLAHRFGDHILHAILADALHVALVTEHTAQVVHTLLVVQPCVVELLIILLELLFVHLLRAL